MPALGEGPAKRACRAASPRPDKLDLIVWFRYATYRAQRGRRRGEDEALSTRRIRASLPAPGGAGARGVHDDPRDRRGGGVESGPRAQADAAVAARRGGGERPRPQGGLPGCRGWGAERERGGRRDSRLRVL